MHLYMGNYIQCVNALYSNIYTCVYFDALVVH